MLADENTETKNERDTTLLALFYGMEQHYSEDTVHCVLDSISGIKKMELFDEWCYEYDKYRFSASLCIYTDSIFRNDSIAKQVFSNIDKMLKEYFYVLVEKRDTFSPKTFVNNTTYKEIFELGKQYFHEQARQMHHKNQDTFEKCLSFRTSIVAVNIHSTPDYVTYLFECSVDYNGSNGCPSSAEYVTFKNDGTALNFEDLISLYPNIMKMDDKLKKAYLNEAKKKWCDFDPNVDPPVSIENNDSNFAIVKEGVLFYYPPYTIGYGSEGQYNLIINPTSANN